MSVVSTLYSKGNAYSTRLACCLVAAPLLAGCTLRLPSSRTYETPERPASVTDEIAPTRTFDHRPYEFIWADRRPEEEPLVGFERLLDWTTRTEHGVEAHFQQTHELQLWGGYVGELKISSADPRGRVVLLPPEPLPLRDRFDSVEMWVHVDEAETLRPDARPLEILLQLRDNRGTRYDIQLATLSWQGWWLARQKLGAEEVGHLEHPCELVSIELEGGGWEGERRIYFDSLAFYTERLPPLVFEERPERPVPLFPGQSPGLYTGAGLLDFPTNTFTIMPPHRPGGFTNEVELVEDTYTFTARSGSGDLVYRYDPAGGLSGIDVTWKGQPVGRFLYGAGLTNGARTVVVDRQEGEKVHVAYDDGVSMVAHLRDNSLCIDVSAPGIDSAEFSLGGLETGGHVERLALPMFGDERWYRPAVYLVQGEEGPGLFVSVLPDWYRSNASELVGASGSDTYHHGRVIYRPTTEGKRNDLFERIVVSVSPRLEEVLPALPHPAGEYARRLSGKMWGGFLHPEVFGEASDQVASGFLAPYTNHVVVIDDAAWCDANESFSFRERSAPGRGGDEGLLQLMAAYREVGAAVGLYVNYHCLSPLNRHWASDAIQRLGDGSWRPSVAGNYAVKPPQGLAWQLELAEAVRDTFEPDLSYLDVHTRLPPWENTDYDARVPGAGCFGQAFFAYGEILQQEREVHRAPVLCSEGFQWLYAGLADAHTAYPGTTQVLAGEPYLPLYYLTRIHPLEVGFGIGDMDAFFSQYPDWRQDVDHALSQYLAAQIAYGRSGRLFPGEFGKAETCRSYYMMQQLQQKYALTPPQRIAYWNGDAFETTSEALRHGSWRRSQLYLNYGDEIEIWVNGHATESWAIRIGRDQVVLPPYGWAASGQDFFELSGTVDGHRIDYVESPEYVYYDGRGSDEPFRGLVSSTPMVIRSEPGLCRVWRPVPGTSTALDTRVLGGRPARGAAFGPGGEELGEAALRWEGETCWIESPLEAVRFALEISVE